MRRLRRCTPTEWLYRCLESELPPFAIQLRIALRALPQVRALERALTACVEANPASRQQLSGRWWLDEGGMPRIVSIDADTPFSLQHAALQRRLAPTGAPPVEVLRWPGAGLVLRASHVSMDAAGLLHFAQDLFRALRGEPLLGSSGFLDDWSLLKASPHCRPLPSLPPMWSSPAGAPSAAAGYVQALRQVRGRVDSPTARIAAALAQASTGGTCRLMIPVDLRLTNTALRTTANLSNPLFLDFESGWDASTCWRHVLGALSRHEQFGVAHATAALRWLPERATGRVLGVVQRWQARHGRHFFSAVSSNLARVSQAAFAFDGQLPTDVAFLPFDTPGAGLNLLTLQHDDALELAASCPAAAGDHGRLHALLDAVCAELERGVVAHRSRPALPGVGPRIAIAATFVAEPLAGVLASWMAVFGVPLAPAFSPYGQVLQALADPNSVFSGNRDGVNVVLLRLEDMRRFADRDDALHANIDVLLDGLARKAARGEAPLVAWLAPLSERGRGNPVLGALQRDFEMRLAAIEGLRLLADTDVRRWYPVAQDMAPLSDALGHIPFTRDRYAALASGVARTVVDVVLPPLKVIVVDCDNTLWRGVCAEQGPLGVEVTDSHRELQAWLVAQVKTGRLVCLASRNEPTDVDAVFAQNPDMLLRPEHVAACRIDWQRKSDNVRALAADLRLGLDSVVFIDDNPVECAEVQAHCPGVQVLLLPQDLAQIPAWLEHLWALAPAVRAEASDRTRLYRQEGEREALRAQSEDFQAFLDSMQLRVTIESPKDGEWERVAELSRRTNQFNLVPKAQTAAHFRSLGAQCLAVHVTDRFGDYGLTGALVLRVEKSSLHVDTWMLSCRVLGRGVEHQVLAQLGELAVRANCDDIVLAIELTARNTPALAFLESTCEPLEKPGGHSFRILAWRACLTRVRAADASVRETDATQYASGTPPMGLPAGVLDLVARERRDILRVRAAAGEHATTDLDDDILSGLIALACSATDGAVGGAKPDDSLVDLGFDSLQIVTLIEEAARVYCPGLAAELFETELCRFLDNPTLRELASTLQRLAQDPYT
ncbi:HAD-IIIC family phosphatase [Mesorhizobium sp. M0954]|uniref:HAD-IIIC family phosphatase n=1 Tax=Mesorhizobium sp. M0954 TaxID=2957032 RepID=UPI003337FE39